MDAPLLPTVKQIIVANAAFEQGIFAKNGFATWGSHHPLLGDAGRSPRLVLK